MLDDDGYPSEYALEVMSSFVGSPHQLVDLIRHLWHWDYVRVRPPWNGVIEVQLVTGGWSGNESVVTALEDTMFHFRWWDSSHRGGLHVYKINVRDWERETYLGDSTHADAARYFDTTPER